MSEYHVSRIMENDPREQKKLAALLEKEGIRKDQNLDYTLGLYDEDYNLAATGSCCGNTLRCMAVDSSHQGEGFSSRIWCRIPDPLAKRGDRRCHQRLPRQRSTPYRLRGSNPRLGTGNHLPVFPIRNSPSGP